MSFTLFGFGMDFCSAAAAVVLFLFLKIFSNFCSTGVSQCHSSRIFMLPVAIHTHSHRNFLCFRNSQFIISFSCWFDAERNEKWQKWSDFFVTTHFLSRFSFAFIFVFVSLFLQLAVNVYHQFAHDFQTRTQLMAFATSFAISFIHELCVESP